MITSSYHLRVHLGSKERVLQSGILNEGNKGVVKHQQYLCRCISGTKGEDKYLI